MSPEPLLARAPAPSARSRAVRSLAALAVGIAIASVAAWSLHVHPRGALACARGAAPWSIAACVGSGLVVLALQAWRWHLVMWPLLALPYGESLRAVLVGTTLNAVLPARGGDLVRVAYIGRRTGKSRATILGTEVVDRWLDWWGLVAVLLVLAAAVDLPSWIFGALALFGGALVIGGALLLVTRRRRRAVAPVSRAAAVLSSFRAGLAAFGSRRTLVIALLVAPLPWVWESAAIAAIGGAFGVHLGFATAFCVLVGFNVATVVPSPGAIGSVEAAGIAALVFFGVPRDHALAFMVVYHFAQLLPVLAIGALVIAASSRWPASRTSPWRRRLFP